MKKQQKVPENTQIVNIPSKLYDIGRQVICAYVTASKLNALINPHKEKIYDFEFKRLYDAQFMFLGGSSRLKKYFVDIDEYRLTTEFISVKNTHLETSYIATDSYLSNPKSYKVRAHRITLYTRDSLLHKISFKRDSSSELCSDESCLRHSKVSLDNICDAILPHKKFLEKCEEKDFPLINAYVLFSSDKISISVSGGMLSVLGVKSEYPIDQVRQIHENLKSFILAYECNDQSLCFREYLPRDMLNLIMRDVMEEMLHDERDATSIEGISEFDLRLYAESLQNDKLCKKIIASVD